MPARVPWLVLALLLGLPTGDASGASNGRLLANSSQKNNGSNEVDYAAKAVRLANSSGSSSSSSGSSGSSSAGGSSTAAAAASLADCDREFARLCGASVRGETPCDICTGTHQHQLQVAGCRHADLTALCTAEEEPALVVLDETLDSFSLYYQASDSGVVAFYERSSGNLTLASCDIDGATSCRTRAEWTVALLATYYDQFFSAIDVVRLSDGRVLIVFIKDFPGSVKALLCADARCAAPPAEIHIAGDSWNGAGDYVRVEADRATVAVAYSDGFNDKTGVKLATVSLARLGVGAFTISSIYNGQVCGPVDVAISAGGLARVAYMGLRCQNVSIAECSDTTCSASTATLVGAKLQPYDPTSNYVYLPSLAVRPVGMSALLAYPSHGSTAGVTVASVGISSGATTVSSAVVANKTSTSRCVVGSTAEGAAMVAYVQDKPAPDYISVMVGDCGDASCSSLRSVQVLESGGLADNLDLVALENGGGGAPPMWMLSYAGNCRNASAPGAPRPVSHACIKVALFSSKT